MTKIESFQFVVFIDPAVEARPAHIIAADFLGNLLPRAFQEVRPGVTQATFVSDDHQLTVVSAPGRYDLMIWKEASDDRPGSRPLEADYIREKWLTLFAAFAAHTGAIRISVVCNGSSQFSSEKEAVAAAEALLPDFAVPKGAVEFDLRLNVPSPSSVVPTLSINRLHRWYTNRIVMMLIGPTGSQSGKEEYLLSETVDVNTQADAVVPADQVEQLYSELFQIGVTQLGKGLKDLEVS